MDLLTLKVGEQQSRDFNSGIYLAHSVQPSRRSSCFLSLWSHRASMFTLLVLGSLREESVCAVLLPELASEHAGSCEARWKKAGVLLTSAFLY